MTDPRDISIDSYDYPLPESKIASHPLAARDSCKLLYRSATGEVSDHIFSSIDSLIPPGSILVYNDTRVIHARLRFRKATGAMIEIFCLEPEQPADYAVNFASTSSCRWKCLVGNAKRWKAPETLTVTATMPDGCDVEVSATQVSRLEGAFEIAFSWPGGYSFAEIIAALGEIPIPPYLNRSTETSDETDYQTVYARHDGSVAAPTAGLHFTDSTLAALDRRGIHRRRVTLHVGAGTFRPVKSDTLSGHDMHAEFISVTLTLIEELAATDRPVYAVGTTTVRTLESLCQAGCMVSQGLEPEVIPQWYAYDRSRPQLNRSQALAFLAGYLKAKGLDTFTADTRIIIAPTYGYRIIDGLITNFHQPRSTLLLLVSALIGDDWRRVYDHALDHGYRFLSYGDACLFENPASASKLSSCRANWAVTTP